MIRNLLARLIAEIMLEAIRERRGCLTAVSDMCAINRGEFHPEGIAKMRLDRIVRLGQAMAYCMPREQYEAMKRKISELFWEWVEKMDDE